jgi:RimJ/RimL family protein N-acetyltransferase
VTDTAPIINFGGEKVALGPIRGDLLPLYQRWLNDFEVTRTLAVGLRPMTAEGEVAWYEGASRADGEVHFQVYERAGLHPVGIASLREIDHANRTAEFGIVIGEKDRWNRGYGTEVARLVLEYGFTALGLHNIWLQAFSFNEGGLKAYARGLPRNREAARGATLRGNRLRRGVHGLPRDGVRGLRIEASPARLNGVSMAPDRASLTGEKVALVPVRSDLTPLYQRWGNDWAVSRTRGIAIGPMTFEAAQEWYARGSMLWGRPGSYDFLVVEISGYRPVGLTAINDVSPVDGTGEFAVMIGERDAWGKGYGTEVTRVMLRFAFATLGLHNLMLVVLAVNERGIRAYERAGFRRIGRRRGSFRMAGLPVDDIYMDCLATEWRAARD